MPYVISTWLNFFFYSLNEIALMMEEKVVIQVLSYVAGVRDFSSWAY